MVINHTNFSTLTIQTDLQRNNSSQRFIKPLKEIFPKGFIFFEYGDIISYQLYNRGKIMVDEKRQLISCMLDIGKEMIKSGAEISRVEDTLIRIGLSYGAKRVNAFALASNILLSIEFQGGEEITRTRRINKGLQNDFTKLEALNDLSRRFCQKNMSVFELHNEYLSIHDSRPSVFRTYFGHALASGSFAIFFGGNIFDGLIAALFGLFICYMQYKITPLCKNNITFIIIVSFISGLGISLLCHPFSFLNPDKIMIGDIMLLVPGVAITNSVRDIFVGDTITGTMRFIECVLSAAALAAGFMLAIFVIGGIL